jgi:hypothetical protein
MNLPVKNAVYFNSNAIVDMQRGVYLAAQPRKNSSRKNTEKETRPESNPSRRPLRELIDARTKSEIDRFANEPWQVERINDDTLKIETVRKQDIRKIGTVKLPAEASMRSEFTPYQPYGKVTSGLSRPNLDSLPIHTRTQLNPDWDTVRQEPFVSWLYERLSNSERNNFEAYVNLRTTRQAPEAIAILTKLNQGVRLSGKFQRNLVSYEKWLDGQSKQGSASTQSKPLLNHSLLTDSDIPKYIHDELTSKFPGGYRCYLQVHDRVSGKAVTFRVKHNSTNYGVIRPPKYEGDPWIFRAVGTTQGEAKVKADAWRAKIGPGLVKTLDESFGKNWYVSEDRGKYYVSTNLHGDKQYAGALFPPQNAGDPWTFASKGTFGESGRKSAAHLGLPTEIRAELDTRFPNGWRANVRSDNDSIWSVTAPGSLVALGQIHILSTKDSVTNRQRWRFVVAADLSAQKPRDAVATKLPASLIAEVEKTLTPGSWYARVAQTKKNYGSSFEIFLRSSNREETSSKSSVGLVRLVRDGAGATQDHWVYTPRKRK